MGIYAQKVITIEEMEERIKEEYEYLATYQTARL